MPSVRSTMFDAMASHDSALERRLARALGVATG